MVPAVRGAVGPRAGFSGIRLAGDAQGRPEPDQSPYSR